MSVRADLDRIISTGKKFLNLPIGVEFSELFGEKKGVVKTAFANVWVNGGERDDKKLTIDRWEDGI